MDAVVTGSVDRLNLPADAREVRTASAWLQQVCSERQVPEEVVFRLDLCLNEILANILSHGGADAAAAPVWLALAVRTSGDGGEAELSVADAGPAFDPLAAEIGSRAATLEDATPGGLGLTMIRAYADRLDYARREDRNHLAAIVGWTS